MTKYKGGHSCDNIYLLGLKFSSNSPFYTKLEIYTPNGNASDCEKLILEHEQIVQRLDNVIAGRKQVLETYRKAGYHDSSLMCREVIYDIIDLERIRSGKTG